MSLWNKLNTLFRASAQEPLEQLVDANGIRIFQQEIRDGESAILQAKHHLATVMAEKKKLARSNDVLQENLANKEQQALAALDKGEDDLAEELAQLIAQDELLLQDQRHQHQYLVKQEAKLKQQLRIAVQSIQQYQRELNLAKANQSAQKALGSLQGYSSGLSVSLRDMASSLERIKQRQVGAMDHDQALQEIDAELDGNQLNHKLKRAGIETGELDASKVLERLRKQRAA